MKRLLLRNILRRSKKRGLAFCCFVLILTCLGCRKRQGVAPQELQRPQVSQALCEQQLSSLTDISLPLGLTQCQFKNTEIAGQHIIDYYSSFGPSIIQDFYELDMERLGWRLLSKFITVERILLLFDKPNTWCTVLIYPCTEIAHTASKTAVFIGQKV